MAAPCVFKVPYECSCAEGGRNGHVTWSKGTTVIDVHACSSACSWWTPNLPSVTVAPRRWNTTHPGTPRRPVASSAGPTTSLTAVAAVTCTCPTKTSASATRPSSTSASFPPWMNTYWWGFFRTPTHLRRLYTMDELFWFRQVFLIPWSHIHFYLLAYFFSTNGVECTSTCSV